MTDLLQAAHEGEFGSMSNEITKWMDRILGASYQHYRPDEAWVPAINLYEGDHGYCVVVDISGMSAGEIDVTVDEEKLRISGERGAPPLPEGCGGVHLHLMEIDNGPFIRTLELPKDAAVDHIEATYRSGYLWIRIPKIS